MVLFLFNYESQRCFQQRRPEENKLKFRYSLQTQLESQK